MLFLIPYSLFYASDKPIPVELANGDRVLALVLDTEGFGATGATEEHDARIFSIATLLCSLLVYNRCGIAAASCCGAEQTA